VHALFIYNCKSVFKQKLQSESDYTSESSEGTVQCAALSANKQEVGLCKRLTENAVCLKM